MLRSAAAFVMTMGLALGFSGSIAAAQERPTTRAVPLNVDMTPVDESRHVVDRGGDGVGLRGPGCAQTVSSHTSANFSGGSFVVQGGFAEQEIAAVTYSVPAASFPIKVALMEVILATSGATMQTTTEYTILVWDGEPNTGALAFEYSSNDLDLPHARVGPGTAGVNIQVSVDPSDPEQIIVAGGVVDPAIPANRLFSIGFRIDNHNNQTADPCFTQPPSGSNAFPCTDVGGLGQPTKNWLFGLNCGPFGCPPNGGWARFSNLNQFCRPSGDWVMRATWEPVNCAVGACCAANGSCIVSTATNCTSGTFTEGVGCDPNPCQAATGACCSQGTCSVQTQAACQGSGGTYQGNGTTCGAGTCPEPTGACCFGSSCSALTAAQCAGFGGVYRGNGVACVNGNQCPPEPTGACCFPNGTCQTLTQANCTGFGGSSWSAGGSCSPNNCPQPTGACCANSSGFCLVNTQAACAGIPNTTWQGAATTCVNGNQCPASAAGACCTGTTCSVVSSAACTSAGGQFQGAGTACQAPGNPTTCCPANFNDQGGVTVQDIYDFLSSWSNLNPAADFNGANGVTVQDIYDFLTAWNAGCAG